MGYGRVVRHQTRHRQVQISRDIHIFYYQRSNAKDTEAYGRPAMSARSPEFSFLSPWYCSSAHQ
jgi:hypothetical protein